jgi:hypothetical protein
MREQSTISREPTPISRILGLCDHADAILSRNAGNNGIGMFCDSCRSWVTRQKGYDRMWLGKDNPALKAVDLEALPVVGVKAYRKCQGRCGELAQCELHHVAPRAFFGEECDEWPMVWLCVPCHHRWHTLVTPGLCTAWEAAVHAQQLMDYLGIDRAAHLTRALTDIGRARRAGAA